MILNYKGYNGSQEFSDEDNIYYGKILGIKDSVTYEAVNKRELKTAFREAVDDYIETIKSLEN